MYKNLKMEMAKKNIKIYQVAEALKVRNATISDKLNEKYSFKFNEAVEIKKIFFPDMSLEYLFETDK